MKTYHTYKPSGIEWIGNIPEHWEVKRLKYKISYQKGKNPKELKSTQTENSEIYLAMDYLRDSSKQVFYVENPEEYVIVNDNEILLLWDGSNAGEFIKSKKGVLSSTMAALTLNEIDKDYTFHYLKTFEKYLKESTIGMGIPHVNGEEFKNSLFVFPNINEQDDIATYLDRKTGEVDSIIANKQKLIAFYEEEKQTIINQSVTRGVDKTVKLKPSGMEWLGDIPEHWDRPCIRHVCQFVLDGTHGSFPRVSNGYRLLSVRNIINDEFVFRDDDSKVSEEHFVEISKRFLIQENDIQLAIVGATLGKVAVVKSLPETFVTQRSVATLRTNEKCIPVFLFYFFKTTNFQSYLWLNAGFSAQPGVYLGTIQSSYIPLPKTEEQESIVAYIKQKCSHLDTLIEKLKKQIELFQEYRTTLISEVVTGKVKVSE